MQIHGNSMMHFSILSGSANHFDPCSLTTRLLTLLEYPQAPNDRREIPHLMEQSKQAHCQTPRALHSRQSISSRCFVSATRGSAVIICMLDQSVITLEEMRCQKKNGLSVTREHPFTGLFPLVMEQQSMFQERQRRLRTWARPVFDTSMWSLTILETFLGRARLSLPRRETYRGEGLASRRVSRASLPLPLS